MSGHVWAELSAKSERERILSVIVSHLEQATDEYYAADEQAVREALANRVVALTEVIRAVQ